MPWPNSKIKIQCMLPAKDYFSNPNILGASLLVHYFKWLPDKLYLRLQYRFKLRRRLNLKNPRRFTEKIQWLKLYDRNPFYNTIVDKYEVKPFIEKIIGSEYVIPTLGVWDRPEDIDWKVLPDKFVLKVTNGGGGTGVVICRDKASFNVNWAIRKLNASMTTDLYKILREWPYKDVPTRIIAEKYLEDESGELRDYKFYCFNGEPKVMLLASDRFGEHNFNYYDMDFNQLPIHSAVGGKAEIQFQRPERFEDMQDIARRLCRDFPHVRVDLYYSDNKIYFGELTLYDSSGYDNLCSDEEDLRWGSWLSLPNKYQKSK